MEIWEAFKKAHYGKKVVVQSEWGTICFDPDSLSEVVDGDRITYEEYLEIQLRSAKKVRHYFERCYYSIPLDFRGQIERRTKNKVCFKRIYVEGMYFDGTCFSGKEDHVWMDLKDFEDCQAGDSVSFFCRSLSVFEDRQRKGHRFRIEESEGNQKNSGIRASF